MKTTKRFLLLLLAAIMALSMSVPAYATEGETSTVTIVNESTDYVYEAYEIFSGDLSDGKLSNITWGTGITAAGREALLSFNGQHTNASEVAAALTESNVSIFSNLVAKYLDESNVQLSTFVPSKNNDAAHYEIEYLSSGYYLIRNRSVAIDGAYTNYILEVVGDTSIRHKASVPTVTKKVKDTNDSSNLTSDWQDSADYDKGDTVPFQLTAVLADNVSTYNWYKIEFQDTLSSGLTYVNNSAKVYVSTDSGLKDVTAAFDISSTSNPDANLLISCDDVKNVSVNATNNSVIIVEYNATLNNNAVIGAQGNSNEVVLAYSNNPNWVPDGYDEENPPATPPENPPLGYTPKDTVVVFTYQVTVNKVDENNNPLPGASFDLYKKESNPDYVPKEPDSEAFVWVKKGSLEATAVYSNTNPDSPVSYSATFDRLDDGDYKICESVTPKGYNTCEDLLFTIDATHDTLSAEPALTVLSAGTLSADLQTGTLSTTIINKAGSVLPETGGIGTTIFYSAGGVLVLSSIVLLVSKKRMK